MNVKIRIDSRNDCTLKELTKFFETDKSSIYKSVNKLIQLKHIESTKETPVKYYSLRKNE